MAEGAFPKRSKKETHWIGRGPKDLLDHLIFKENKLVTKQIVTIH